MKAFLHQLLQEVWMDEEIPDDRDNEIIMKLPKKGDLGQCDNLRGIALVSLPSKVFCWILLKRIDKEIDQKLREKEAGFRANRGCYWLSVVTPWGVVFYPSSLVKDLSPTDLYFLKSLCSRRGGGFVFQLVLTLHRDKTWVCVCALGHLALIIYKFMYR